MKAGLAHLQTIRGRGDEGTDGEGHSDRNLQLRGRHSRHTADSDIQAELHTGKGKHEPLYIYICRSLIFFKTLCAKVT